MDYKGKVLTLTIGESTVNKDGELIEIDAEPYISGGRTMVPLRFVAETFGLSVGYKDKVVHIETPEVLINNRTVDVIQNEYYMTMGGIVAESDSNLCINRMRQVFESAKKTEVVAPGNFGTGYDMDTQSYYYHQMKYTLLDEKDGLLESYEVYYEISYGMSTDTYVLRDVLNDKWYEFSKEEYDLLIELETIGDWNEISNTVA